MFNFLNKLIFTNAIERLDKSNMLYRIRKGMTINIRFTALTLHAKVITAIIFLIVYCYLSNLGLNMEHLHMIINMTYKSNPHNYKLGHIVIIVLFISSTFINSIQHTTCVISLVLLADILFKDFFNKKTIFTALKFCNKFSSMFTADNIMQFIIPRIIIIPIVLIISKIFYYNFTYSLESLVILVLVLYVPLQYTISLINQCLHVLKNLSYIDTGNNLFALRKHFVIDFNLYNDYVVRSTNFTNLLFRLLLVLIIYLTSPYIYLFMLIFVMLCITYFCYENYLPYTKLPKSIYGLQIKTTSISVSCLVAFTVVLCFIAKSSDTDLLPDRFYTEPGGGHSSLLEKYFPTKDIQYATLIKSDNIFTQIFGHKLIAKSSRGLYPTIDMYRIGSVNYYENVSNKTTVGSYENSSTTSTGTIASRDTSFYNLSNISFSNDSSIDDFTRNYILNLFSSVRRFEIPQQSDVEIAKNLFYLYKYYEDCNPDELPPVFDYQRVVDMYQETIDMFGHKPNLLEKGIKYINSVYKRPTSSGQIGIGLTSRSTFPAYDFVSWWSFKHFQLEYMSYMGNSNWKGYPLDFTDPNTVLYNMERDLEYNKSMFEYCKAVVSTRKNIPVISKLGFESNLSGKYNTLHHGLYSPFGGVGQKTCDVSRLYESTRNLDFDLLLEIRESELLDTIGKTNSSDLKNYIKFIGSILDERYIK